MKLRISGKKVIIALALFFLFIIGVLYYLVTWGGNLLVFKSTPATVTASKIRELEKTGGNLELGEADINGLVETQVKRGISAGGVKTNKVLVKVEEGTIKVYIPSEFHGIGILLYCEGKLSYKEGLVIFTPDIFKAGKIGLPKSLVMGKLKNFSSESITISDDSINISKNMIPFEISGLTIEGDKAVAAINKVVAATPQTNPSSTNTEKTGSKGGGSGTRTTSTQDLLKKASRQLSGVYSSVKSQKNKDIVSRIQTTVNKMISDPSYNYQKDADAVKAMKNGLTPSEKEELQNAILDNMDTSTIKQIRSTFGV